MFALEGLRERLPFPMQPARESVVSATMVGKSSLRQAFGPETLSRLMIVYDECLQELLTWYAGSEPSDLNGMETTLAERIMAAAAHGIVDPTEFVAMRWWVWCRQEAWRGNALAFSKRPETYRFL